MFKGSMVVISSDPPIKAWACPSNLKLRLLKLFLIKNMEDIVVFLDYNFWPELLWRNHNFQFPKRKPCKAHLF